MGGQVIRINRNFKNGLWDVKSQSHREEPGYNESLFEAVNMLISPSGGAFARQGSYKVGEYALSGTQGYGVLSEVKTASYNKKEGKISALFFTYERIAAIDFNGINANGTPDIVISFSNPADFVGMDENVIKKIKHTQYEDKFYWTYNNEIRSIRHTADGWHVTANAVEFYYPPLKVVPIQTGQRINMNTGAHVAECSITASWILNLYGSDGQTRFQSKVPQSEAPTADDINDDDIPIQYVKERLTQAATNSYYVPLATGGEVPKWAEGNIVAIGLTTKDAEDAAAILATLPEYTTKIFGGMTKEQAIANKWPNPGTASGFTIHGAIGRATYSVNIAEAGEAAKIGVYNMDVLIFGYTKGRADGSTEGADYPILYGWIANFEEEGLTFPNTGLIPIHSFQFQAFNKETVNTRGIYWDQKKWSASPMTFIADSSLNLPIDNLYTWNSRVIISSGTTLYLSSSYDVRLDYRYGTAADNAFYRKINIYGMGNIVWLIDWQDYLIVGCTNGIFLCYGDTKNGPVSANNFLVAKVSNIGCANIQPTTCENGIIFVENNLRKIYILASVNSALLTKQLNPDCEDLFYKGQGIVSIRYSYLDKKIYILLKNGTAAYCDLSDAVNIFNSQVDTTTPIGGLIYEKLNVHYLKSFENISDGINQRLLTTTFKGGTALSDYKMAISHSIAYSLWDLAENAPGLWLDSAKIYQNPRDIVDFAVYKTPIFTLTYQNLYPIEEDKLVIASLITNESGGLDTTIQAEIFSCQMEERENEDETIGLAGRFVEVIQPRLVPREEEQREILKAALKTNIKLQEIWGEQTAEEEWILHLRFDHAFHSELIEFILLTQDIENSPLKFILNTYQLGSVDIETDANEIYIRYDGTMPSDMPTEAKEIRNSPALAIFAEEFEYEVNKISAAIIEDTAEISDIYRISGCQVYPYLNGLIFNNRGMEDRGTYELKTNGQSIERNIYIPDGGGGLDFYDFIVNLEGLPPINSRVLGVLQFPVKEAVLIDQQNPDVVKDAFYDDGMAKFTINDSEQSKDLTPEYITIIPDPQHVGNDKYLLNIDRMGEEEIIFSITVGYEYEKYITTNTISLTLPDGATDGMPITQYKVLLNLYQSKGGQIMEIEGLEGGKPSPILESATSEDIYASGLKEVVLNAQFNRLINNLRIEGTLNAPFSVLTVTQNLVLNR